MQVAIIDAATMAVPSPEVHTLVLRADVYTNLCTPRYTTTNICLEVKTIDGLNNLISATETTVKQILKAQSISADIFLGLEESYCNLLKFYFDTIMSPEYITQQRSPSAPPFDDKTFETNVFNHLVESFKEFSSPRNGQLGGVGRSEPGLWRKLCNRFKIKDDQTVTFNSVTTYIQPKANPPRTSQLNPNNSPNSYSRQQVYRAKKNNAKRTAEMELVAKPDPKTFDQYLKEILDHEPELLLHIYADKLLGSFKDAVNKHIAASPINQDTILKMIASINALKPQIQELLLSRLFRQHVATRNVNTSLVMSIANELVTSAEKASELAPQFDEFKKKFVFGYNIITKFARDVDYFVEPAYHIVITADGVQTNLVFYSDEIQILYKSIEYKKLQPLLEDLFKNYKRHVHEIGITEAPKNYLNWKCNNYAFDVCYIVKHKILLNPDTLFDRLVLPHVRGTSKWSMSINNWFASHSAQNTLLNQLNNTVNVAIFTLSKWIQFKRPTPTSEREDLLRDFINRFQESIGHSSIYYNRRLYNPQLKTPYIDMVLPLIDNLLTNCSGSINLYHDIIKCYDVYLQRLIQISSKASINVLSSYTDANQENIKPFYYIVFEILLCRYMGVHKPTTQTEISNFNEFIAMMVSIIAENNIPFTRFAHEHMQDELIELLKNGLITNKKLFIKYVVFKHFYRGSCDASDEKEVIDHIFENYVSNEDINKLKGFQNKLAIPEWLKQYITCSEDDCGVFQYTHTGLSLSNKYKLDIERNSHHKVLGNEGSNSYGALMNGLFLIIQTAITRERDLKSLFGDSGDVVGMMHEYKTFSDKLYVILKDLSHSIYSTFRTLKITIENDKALSNANVKQSTLAIFKALQVPPEFPPGPQEGGNEYFSYQGRRYKIRKEGKRQYIMTKDGKISLSQARKEQTRYEKNKAKKLIRTSKTKMSRNK